MLQMIRPTVSWPVQRSVGVHEADRHETPLKRAVHRIDGILDKSDDCIPPQAPECGV